MIFTIISRGMDGSIIPPRTKKTSGRIVKCGKFPRLLPSKAFEEWQAGAIGDLRRAITRTIDYPVNCRALIYRDALRGDAVGFYQAIADLLEAAGVVVNDTLIVSWDGSRLLKDATRPRVEVELLPPSLSDCEEQLRLAKGVIAANDERLKIAGERVGIYFDCDTPDHMADEIEGLRAKLRKDQSLVMGPRT